MSRPGSEVCGLLLLLLAGCARIPRGPAAVPLPGPLAPLPIRADSSVVDTLAPGVVHHALTVREGPWAIHVLDVDRSRCWTLASLKAGNQAVGRSRTSDLVESAARTLGASGRSVAGAVNADFFSFTPPGVPTGASIHDGRVIAGPGARPIVASDSAGRPWIGTLSVWGWVASGADTVAVAAWNRRSGDGVAVFDPAFGPTLDTATSVLRIVLGPGRLRQVVAVDSSGGELAIGQGVVVSLGAGAPPALRRRLLSMAGSGRPMEVAVGLLPFFPREAVGGFPVLVRDSVTLPGVDSAGGPGFGPVRHPRTLVGVAAGGRRLLLVTVDGRQPGFSAGMTLREAAELMRSLGTPAAINLDGGGSTTMVVRRAWSGSVRYLLANRPSDPAGERAVANALAVVTSGTGCPIR